MICAHCGAMRRAEGGLRIGGRVSLNVVPSCPCAELPQLAEGEPITLGPLTLGANVGGFAQASFHYRLCTAESGYLRPRVLGVEVINYEPPFWYLAGRLFVVDIWEQGCSFNPLDGYIGSALWEEGIWSGYSCANLTGEPLYALGLHLGVELLRGSEFPDDPQVMVTVQFDREGCT